MARFDDIYDMIVAADGDMDAVLEDLNAAVDKYNNEFQKEKDAENIAKMLNSLCDKYYPDVPGEFSAEHIIDIFDLSDAVADLAKKAEGCGKTLEEMIEEKGW